MNATPSRYQATTETLTHIAALVSQARPDWPQGLVLQVLSAHAHQVDGSDLAIAAIRAALTPTFHTPKTIGWRGPHWDGLRSMPPGMMSSRRCGVCGKFEDLCLTTRVGVDDDHEFEAVEPRHHGGPRVRPPVR